MPYETIETLPEGIKDNLPEHAQKIYKSAYNSAYEQYRGEGSESSLEERAHRVAWAAVKQKYEKTNGRWSKK